jgi:ABC-type branched-subunit amino acid transport system substrate-binding protein
VLPVFLTGCRNETGKPVKIGVLMPLSGPDAMETEKTLDWAAAKINSGGGIGGRKVMLAYKDTYNQDIVRQSQEFISDPDIDIVIGPYRSADVFLAAPLFIKNKKLLISPTATAGEISRAFGKEGYFWRTVQPDVTQIRCILAELASRNVKKFSLIYTDTSYGQTFYQWAGFFADELGLEIDKMVPYGKLSNLEDVLDEALAGQPEYIVAASYAAEAVTFKKILDSKNISTKLFFTDAVETPFVLSELGQQALGLELMTPAADPSSGFEISFNDEFGYMPFDTAASTYDAFLLSVCTLARQQSRKSWNPFKRKESLPQSFKAVTAGDGQKLYWDQINEAVKLILDHKAIDIGGAASRLEFDKNNGVDPVQSFYSLNRVETRNGFFDFYTTNRFSSDITATIGVLQDKTSSVFTMAAKKADPLEQGKVLFKPGERENLWAVIIATSSGWENYRHQADALAMYNLLKKNGLPDERIILILEDDIPMLLENIKKGDVHYKVNGANLRKEAILDYKGDAVNLENLKNILLGISTSSTPTVLGSGKGSNVFLYMVDHGAPGKMPFYNGEHLTSDNLASIVSGMSSKGMFRQLFIMVEACFGESIGSGINTPGVVYFTGAAKSEASFGATYDSNIKQWLADDFTTNVISNISSKPDISIRSLFLETYEKVIGSHVTLLNYDKFGDLSVPVTEFIAP